MLRSNLLNPLCVSLYIRPWWGNAIDICQLPVGQTALMSILHCSFPFLQFSSKFWVRNIWESITGMHLWLSVSFFIFPIYMSYIPYLKFEMSNGFSRETTGKTNIESNEANLFLNNFCQITSGITCKQLNVVIN